MATIIEQNRLDQAAEITVSSGPEQDEMPFALVHGEAYTELPKDLYIPPDADLTKYSPDFPPDAILTKYSPDFPPDADLSLTSVS